MSLEDAVKDNTAAIRDLIHALGAQRAAAPNTVPTPGKPVKEAKPAATQPTAAAPAAPTQSAEPSTTIDFVTQIQQPIIKLAATGKRDLAMSILTQFGAAKASEIKPADYAAAVEAIAKATA